MDAGFSPQANQVKIKNNKIKYLVCGTGVASKIVVKAPALGIRRPGRKYMATYKGNVSRIKSSLEIYWRNVRIYWLRRQLFALERRRQAEGARR